MNLAFMNPNIKKIKSGWRTFPGIEIKGSEIPKSREVYSEKLFKCIETVTGISRNTLMDGRRLRQHTEARYIYWTMLKEEFPYLTLAELGKVFGRDHATVLNAFKKNEEWLSHKPNGTVMEVGYYYKMTEVRKLFNEILKP